MNSPLPIHELPPISAAKMEGGQGWKEVIKKRLYGAGSKCDVSFASPTDSSANANADAHVSDSAVTRNA